MCECVQCVDFRIVHIICLIWTMHAYRYIYTNYKYDVYSSCKYIISYIFFFLSYFVSQKNSYLTIRAEVDTFYVCCLQLELLPILICINKNGENRKKKNSWLLEFISFERSQSLHLQMVTKTTNNLMRRIQEERV